MNDFVLLDCVRADELVLLFSPRLPLPTTLAVLGRVSGAVIELKLKIRLSGSRGIRSGAKLSAKRGVLCAD